MPQRRVRQARPIPYDEFRQRVRRYQLTATLKAIARLNAELQAISLSGGKHPTMPSHVTPFALAGIARTALISANEFRSTGPTEAQLSELCFDHINVTHPEMDLAASDFSARALLNRIAYEQFGHQFSAMENIGRTLSLFGTYGGQVRGAPTEAEWEALLGCTLEQYIRLGFGMQMLALNAAGQISITSLREPGLAQIFHPLGVEKSIEVLNRWFVSTPDALKQAGGSEERPGLEKWCWNPLVQHPVVQVGDLYIVPWPWLLLHRVTPTGLYYVGYDAWGPSFTDSLGEMFELYCGSQLRLLTEASIIPEITYGATNEKTVDYFVVTPEVVVLVEVKSSRPIVAARLGESDGDQDIERKVGHAYRQIDRTTTLIQEGHPALDAIPQDRPLRGLVVTLEPFHLVNTPFYDDVLTRPSIPTCVVSAHELESTCATLSGVQDLGARLLRGLNRDGELEPSISNALDGLEPVPNPILEAAWDRFYEPWVLLAGRSRPPHRAAEDLGD